MMTAGGRISPKQRSLPMAHGPICPSRNLFVSLFVARFPRVISQRSSWQRLFLMPPSSRAAPLSFYSLSGIWPSTPDPAYLFPARSLRGLCKWFLLSALLGQTSGPARVSKDIVPLNHVHPFPSHPFATRRDVRTALAEYSDCTIYRFDARINHKISTSTSAAQLFSPPRCHGSGMA